MHLPTRSRALLLALALAVPGAGSAQDRAAGFDPRTGDAWVDTWLADINRYGGAYRDPFVDEMVRYHGAPRDLVLELLRRPGWSPGDVYFACRLAATVGRPCRYVADQYERDRGEGWGAVARRLGIQPGSAEFHRLKRGFVPTYDRWGRPIRVDAELARDFPGRPMAPARSRGEAPDAKPAPKRDDDPDGRPAPGQGGPARAERPEPFRAGSDERSGRKSDRDGAGGAAAASAGRNRAKDPGTGRAPSRAEVGKPGKGKDGKRGRGD